MAVPNFLFKISAHYHHGIVLDGKVQYGICTEFVFFIHCFGQFVNISVHKIDDLKRHIAAGDLKGDRSLKIGGHNIGGSPISTGKRAVILFKALNFQIEIVEIVLKNSRRG